MLNLHGAELAVLAMKAQLPTLHMHRSHVEAGALMAYGPDWRHQYRRAAAYVDKILKGAKPAELPIEQPAKFEFVINTRTAKALDLAIRPSVLLRAEVVG